MAADWPNHRDLISPKLSRCIVLGMDMPHQDYLAAIALGESCRARLPAIFEGFDILLAPCVQGEAPVGLDSTRDPGFQAIWTILHVPTLCLPTYRGPNGLPVGIHLIVRRYH